MACAWMTPIENGQCETSIYREGFDKIIIVTPSGLTDEQVEGLFWIVNAMAKSGKALNELIKDT